MLLNDYFVLCANRKYYTYLYTTEEVMLESLIRHDKLLLSLLENSNYTNVQLDVFMSYVMIRRSQGKLEDIINAKDGSKVTRGSFLRTLEQARSNIKSSVYSILLLGYLGFADSNFIDGFIRISRMLEELNRLGYVNDPKEIVELINKLSDRLSDL